MRFLNDLFLAAASGGGWIRGGRAEELYLHLGSVQVSFTLDKIPLSRNRQEPNPTEKKERLRLMIEARDPPTGTVTQWEDLEGSQIDDRLTEIIMGMAVAGEHLRRQWIKQQLEWERQLREEAECRAQELKREAARKERERLAAIAKVKVDALRSDAVGWHEAKTIRVYIEAARSAIVGRVENDAVERRKFESSRDRQRLSPKRRPRHTPWQDSTWARQHLGKTAPGRLILRRSPYRLPLPWC